MDYCIELRVFIVYMLIIKDAVSMKNSHKIKPPIDIYNRVHTD